MGDQINAVSGINVSAGATSTSNSSHSVMEAAGDSALSASYGSDSSSSTSSIDSVWSSTFEKQSEAISDSDDKTKAINAAVNQNSLTLQAYTTLTSDNPDLSKLSDSQSPTVGASTINSSGQRETKNVETFINVDAGTSYVTAHASEIFGAGVDVNSLSATEKAQKISDYVTKNATYVADSTPNWSTFSQFTGSGLKGDCEDIANFTASLMRGAGLTSDQVKVGVDAGAAGSVGHVEVILNLDGKNASVLDISAQTESHTTANINNLQSLSSKESTNPFEVVYSDKGGVKADGSHVFDNGVTDTTAVATTSATTTTTTTKEIKDSSGNVIASGATYAEALDNFVKIKEQTNLPSYVNDPKKSKNENANAATANEISGLTDTLTDMAVMISDNSTMMEDAGALYLVQQKMQKIKDAITAITAAMKLVNESVSNAVSTFVTNMRNA